MLRRSAARWPILQLVGSFVESFGRWGRGKRPLAIFRATRQKFCRKGWDLGLEARIKAWGGPLPKKSRPFHLCRLCFFDLLQRGVENECLMNCNLLANVYSKLIHCEGLPVIYLFDFQEEKQRRIQDDDDDDDQNQTIGRHEIDLKDPRPAHLVQMIRAQRMNVLKGQSDAGMEHLVGLAFLFPPIDEIEDVMRQIFVVEMMQRVRVRLTVLTRHKTTLTDNESITHSLYITYYLANKYINTWKEASTFKENCF